MLFPDPNHSLSGMEFVQGCQDRAPREYTFEQLWGSSSHDSWTIVRFTLRGSLDPTVVRARCRP